jgi:arginyl-tRNA synthetase
MVLGKDGKPFKTRAGESVKLNDLLNEAVQRAQQLVAAKNPDMPEHQQFEIAKAVGIGAVKYADLSKNRTSDYVFDWDSMLSFEGNTAPYLQYACVRPARIALRVGSWKDSIPFSLDAPMERALGVHLMRFEDALRTMARDSTPHVLCAYLYDLASAYSRFYEHCPVIEGEAVNTSRLKLSNLAGRTLAAGLELLGIAALREM